MRDIEERLARLEEGQFFQEERLTALDSALAAQQGQLDRLEASLADAASLLRLLRDRLDEANKPENSLPPHFMPERY